MKKLIVLLIVILAAALLSGVSFASATRAERTYTSGQLIGLNVDTLEGKHVGKIRDINLDFETGEINYVILGISLLGIGEEKFRVPLEALEIQNNRGRTNATLVISENKLMTRFPM